MRMIRKQLFTAAKAELKEWGPTMPRGIVMAILFCFVYRVLNGERLEDAEWWQKPETPIDYEI